VYFGHCGRQPTHSLLAMAKTAGKDPDLEKFLRNVDEVDSIIKGLASNDASATEKADEFLERYQRGAQISNVGVNR